MPLIITVADSFCHLQLLSQICVFTQRKMYDLMRYSCFGWLNVLAGVKMNIKFHIFRLAPA